MSTDGDDNNDGLSEQTPWQTLDHAEANGTGYATPPTIGAYETEDIIFIDGFESGTLSSWGPS